MADINAAAGPPAGYLTEPGTTQLSGFGALGSRIVYAVYEVINSSDHYVSLGRLGEVTAAGRLNFQTGATDNPQVSCRIDTAGGTTNATVSTSTARTPGVHIIWSQVKDGMTLGEVGTDSPAVRASRTLTPGTGMPDNPALVLLTPYPGTIPKAILAYKGSHDELTRARVVRTLAETYGVPIDPNGWPTDEVRAQDQSTLQVLPTPSYTRQFYLKQASTLNPPAKPTTNPPPAPWSTTEPTYTDGSTDTLYTTWLTAWGAGYHEYGDVQKSSSYEAAKAAWNKANNAQDSATSAYDRADAALTMAGSKSKAMYSTLAPSGSAAANDIWRRLPTPAEITAGASAGDIMQEWRYTGTAWQEVKVSTTAIANLDVGKLTLGTGVISDLVAQHIAARSGQFIELGVHQLDVTGSAAIREAVIEKLWADVVKAKFLTVTEKFIANDVFAEGVVSAAALAGNAIDGKTVTGATMRTAASGQRMQFDASGLRAFDSTGTEVGRFSTSDEGIQFTAANLVGAPTRFLFGKNGYLNNLPGLLLESSSSPLDSATAALYTADYGPGADGQIARLKLAVRGSTVDAGAETLEIRVKSGAQPRVVFMSSGPIRFSAPVEFQDDTNWANVSVPGATGSCQWRRYAGVVYVRFDVTFSTAVPANGVKDPMVTLPVAPTINAPLNIYSQGSYAAAGFVENTGRVVFRNQHTASATRFIGTTQWLAN